MLALALAGGIAARDLAVPAGKGWQHARTGLILPASLDGLPRTQLIDTTQGEWDVAARFATPGDATIASVYVYHPAIDDTAMWFERARTQIQERDVYGGVEATTAEPVAFAPPGTTGAPTALRQTFRAGGPFKSTALAVIPLGEWLVAVRVSAREEGAAALDERLTRIIAAIRWPKAAPPAPALHPIDACPDALRFEKAKIVATRGSDLLMTLLAVAVVRDLKASRDPKVNNDPKVRKDAKPMGWCLDPATTRARGIYRSLDGSAGYMIALQDAGRSIGVWPSLGSQIGTKGAAAFSISLEEVDGSTAALPSFDKLPAPDQVVALLGGPVRGRVTGQPGKKTTITLDPKAL